MDADAPGARTSEATNSLPTLPPPGDPSEPSSFIVTKEHRRFIEFAEACRRDRYIGLCYGPPGVGKTLSARRHAHWDYLEERVRHGGRYMAEGRQRPDWHTVMYTPTLHTTPRLVDKDLAQLNTGLTLLRGGGVSDTKSHHDPHGSSRYVELLIVDEADRLKTVGLEQLRDHYDRSHLGLILIGMPGIEKRLARFPQLYSRIGFVHEYRALSANELTFVLEQHWSTLGLTLSASDFTDTEALAAVARITGGNFRLIQRLFAQITRVLEINNLRTITREVVETARESLVIGTL